MILTCQHCKVPFEHNSPRARYCQRNTACRAARDEHIKQRNHRNWYAWKAGHTRNTPKKGYTIRACLHCKTEFEGRANQLYCRHTPECTRASWVHYQARHKAKNAEYRKDERSGREMARPKGKRRDCVVCHRAITNGNRWYCSKCHRAVSTYYVDPQATEYDTYRGQPRL